VDIIIALGMAKEGFDWIWCEHALTIGYRASLTEVIQIIGRATRDAPGKTRARFTNLIAEPDASEEAVTDAVNDTLKAIAASLLMEQVLARDVRRLEEHRAIELVPARDGSGIAGALLIDVRTGAYRFVAAKAVLLATGAGPTMYLYHTPSGDKSCDGLAMALRAGLTLRDMEMVQFHPTGLLAGPDTRRTGTVLEEGLRGAGGYLLNGDGERFMLRHDPAAERATRDLVSRAIYAEMRSGRTTAMGGVYIEMAHLGPAQVARRFPSPRGARHVKRRNYRKRVGSGRDHFGGPPSPDAADRNHRPPSGFADRGAHSFETDHRLRIRLRPGGKDRADRQIVARRGARFSQLGEGMGGQTENPAVSQKLPGAASGEIVLADVRTTSAGKQRDIHPVVHEERDPRSGDAPDTRANPVQELSRGHVLGS